MWRGVFFLFILFFIITASVAFGEDDYESLDITDGFEDSEIVYPEEEESDCRDDGFIITGSLSVSTAFNISKDPPENGETDPDQRGLSELKGEFALELDCPLKDSWTFHIDGKGSYDAVYAIKGKDKYSDEILDSQESELELGELFVRGSIGHSSDLKIGRQVVVWGRSDNIRVTDVICPLDMRKPGMTDIEDIRLPQWMARYDFYKGPWIFTGLALFENRVNMIPAYGSDYYSGELNLTDMMRIAGYSEDDMPWFYDVSDMFEQWSERYIDFIQAYYNFDYPVPEHETPESGLGNMKWGASVTGIFSGWDVSLYYAQVYDTSPYAEAVTSPWPAVSLEHAEIEMAGAALSFACGDWLFISEIAFFDGIKYSFADSQYKRTDILAGAEYSGVKNTIIDIEAALRHIDDYDEALENSPGKPEELEVEYSIRIAREFINNTLNISLIAYLFGKTGDRGALERFTAEYDLNDSIEITGGVIFYQSGSLPAFSNMGSNDRIFAEISYSF